LSLVVLFAGCDQEGTDDTDASSGDPSEEVTISGPITAFEGAERPADAQLAVVWVVSAGSPDTEYAFGGGALDGETFGVNFPELPPPDGALNDFRPEVDARLGVGVIIALPPGVERPPEGPLDRPTTRELVDRATGGADRYAVIYVEGDYPADFWASRFEPGVLQCGRGVPPEGDSPFESFEPVGCDEVELRFGMPLDWVNWT